MMEESFQYCLNSFKQDFPKFTESFKLFCEQYEMESSKIFDLEISLEELIVNSFTYGNANGPVTISATASEKEIKVTLEDKAPPFNLLREAPEPAQDKDIEQRKAGGFGIHLVKNLNDRIEYAGSQKGNRITLFKNFK